MTYRVSAIFPICCTGGAVSYSVLEICGKLKTFGNPARVWVPTALVGGRRDFVHEVVGRPWRSVQRLPCGERLILERLYRDYLRNLTRQDAAYVWPGVPRRVLVHARARSSPVILERINCHLATANELISPEYLRLGARNPRPISAADIAEEDAVIALADWVFAPSPMVVDSLLARGVPTRKILESSYGWDPRRLASGAPLLPSVDGLTVAFVGRVCVRKGAHLLFEAWRLAGIRGRLVLAGEVAPEVAARCGEFLARDDVVVLGHVSDVGRVFRSAQVFAMPTLEEGGPMVTYEAMGCGLPVVVSPMGAGAIARNGVDGFVIPPQSTDAWVESLRCLARDEGLRTRMGVSARERAADFTWDKVAARRGRLLESALLG